MDEYYVERRENENGEHIVHKECCPSLPAKDKMQYIGVRSNAVAPLKEAANFWYSLSAPCPECINS